MIVICGATGTVGELVVSALLARGQKVRALTRHPETADLPADVEIVGGDLDDPASLGPVFDGAKQVFIASAGDVTRHDTLAAQAAAAAGARRLVKLSVVGAHDAAQAENTPARAHVAGERAVRETGLEWNFLRPGAFMTNALGWADQIRAGDIVRAPFADVPAAPIDPRDIAEIAALALLEELPARTAYPLSGPQRLSPADQVARLGAALGRTLRCDPVPDEKVKQGMRSNGMPDAVVEGLFDLLGEPRPENTLFPTVEEVTGLPARSFDQWLADHLSAFAAA